MTRDPSTYGDFEYRAEVGQAVTPGGSRYNVLRVTWRRRGSRPWQSFLLAPDAGVAFDAVCAVIGPEITARSLDIGERPASS